jgi:hypothetical protein
MTDDKKPHSTGPAPLPEATRKAMGATPTLAKAAAVAVVEPQDDDYPPTETSQRIARFAMLQYLLRKIILVHEAGDKARTPLHEVIKNADNWLKENGLSGSKVRLAAAHPAIPGRFNAHRLKAAEECNERLMSACTEAGCPDGVNMADWIRENVHVTSTNVAQGSPPAASAQSEVTTGEVAEPIYQSRVSGFDSAWRDVSRECYEDVARLNSYEARIVYIARPASEQKAPYLSCPICNGIEGCDHTVPERERAASAQKGLSDEQIKSEGE